MKLATANGFDSRYPPSFVSPGILVITVLTVTFWVLVYAGILKIFG